MDDAKTSALGSAEPQLRNGCLGFWSVKAELGLRGPRRECHSGQTLFKAFPISFRFMDDAKTSAPGSAEPQLRNGCLGFWSVKAELGLRGPRRGGTAGTDTNGTELRASFVGFLLQQKGLPYRDRSKKRLN